jgi:Uma2 family endonuclease
MSKEEPIVSTIEQARVIHYPDSDGKPMADNTVQFDWISIIKWNLEHQFAADPNVFVAGDHLIYPEEGKVNVCQAPDVYVAFGPPKGDRGSFKVWEEGVFPQVVFEVWSPNNRPDQMEKKKSFYEKYGAEEYYIVYPEYPAHAEGWLREGQRFIPIPEMNGCVSLRLGIRFIIEDGNLQLIGQNGRRFVSPSEIAAERDEAEERVRQEQKRAKQEQKRAEQEQKRAERFAAKLRELGIDPDSL